MMTSIRRQCSAAIMALLLAMPVFAETLITYRQAESPADTRYAYDLAVLQLALDKTAVSHGPYKLQPSPRANFPRAVMMASRNLLPNFVLKLSYEQDYKQQDLIPIPFPIDLGIVGYRVCFTSTDLAAQLKQVDSVETLKQLSFGQGSGWADVAILRANGLTVETAPNYESLFEMVARSRFDLFCRGANELLAEYQSHRHIDGLTYDTHLALHYDLPRFFYTHKENETIAERIAIGLELAFEDGSLYALWQREYQDSVDFSALPKRQVFRLHNPLLEGIDRHYRRYFINPMEPNWQP